MPSISHAAHAPRLDPGVTVLGVPGERSTALHRLAVARLLDEPGSVRWIDSRNAANTRALYRIAPSRRVVAGLRIARAFTAHQHHELVRTLPGAVDSRTSLVVVSNLPSLYRDDGLPDDEARDLLDAGLAVLDALAAARSIPVLVSVARDGDDLARRVRETAGRSLACERTGFGHRFVGDGYETTAYWDDRGWQTTIPYWVDLLGAVGDPVAAADVDPAFPLGV